MATATVTGIITSKGRETMAKSFGYIGGYPITYGKFFKIGVGGYVDTVAGKVPRPPSEGEGYTDIEASVSGAYFFQKDFDPQDILFISPSTLQCRCRLQAPESNDDGSGSSPKFYEIGIFDDNNNLLGYATFDEQTKTASKTLTNFVQFYF